MSVRFPIRTEFVEANGLRFEVLTCGDTNSGSGEQNRLALCLHGFPEVALSWGQQMPALAALGYRVWAPNQRGYGQSSRPEGIAAYAIEHLMADVAALIDISGARDVVLVAHDWGALVAWTFATRRLRPLRALIILNVPHPVCFTRALRRPGQMLRSWYVLLFQLPLLPEWLLSRNGGEAVRQMIHRTSTAPRMFPHNLLDACAANAAQPGAAHAMVNWYRAFVRGGGLRRQLRLGFPPIPTPVLLLWGMQDTALAYSTTEGTAEFAPHLTRVDLPGVSHWVQQDATEACNTAIVRFLSERDSDSAAEALSTPPATRLKHVA